jgi:hypothetical protein
MRVRGLLAFAGAMAVLGAWTPTAGQADPPPVVSRHGESLTWTVAGTHDLYRLLARGPGVRTVSTVKGTTITPPAVPDATVTYRIKAAYNESKWSNGVSIAYPGAKEEGEPPDEGEGPPEEREATAPAYRGAQTHSLWYGVSSAEMTEELEALAASGANVMRVDVAWASLEAVKGQSDPGYLAKLDALAAGAQKRGIRLLLTLACTPRWASPGGAWNDAPSHAADYGDFARFITARYGAELAGVEAWNEPEINNNLLAADLPATYVQMVKAFYTGAKEGNADVPVLAGALSYADLPFLSALYRDGIGGYYDAISLHPYADGAAPEDRGVVHSFLGGIEALHRFQLANGDTTPEWVTEFGWPVGTSPGANTESQQAQYVEEAFGLLNALPYVQGATVYQLRDMGVDPSNPEDNFGLLHQDFSPRPAYAAFKAAMLATWSALGEAGIGL